MISVCMATYNGEKFIKKQLESIISQLSNDDELIISDDGSNDKTIEIIKSFNDKRIKIFQHQNKINKYYKKSKVAMVTYNFENALNYASGDIIFLSDQDDIWYPTKISKTVPLLTKSNLVLSNFSIIDETGNIKIQKYMKKCPFSKILLKNILFPPFLGCAMAFSSDVLKKALPIPEKVCIHDLWIGLVAQKMDKIIYLDEPLIYHRFWSSNTSNYGKKSENTLIMKFVYRFWNLIEIIKR